MKTMGRRAISLLLCFFMTFGMMPISVFADGDSVAVTYNANGGHFGDDTTHVSNSVQYSLSQPYYSYTENLSEDGTQNDCYGGEWGNSNIRGTGRDENPDNYYNEQTGYYDAHVVTIPGASSLTVTIDYEGESTSYDWACVWAGSHPDYNANDNYKSSISGKLGGSRDRQTFEIEGDSVTFSFISDGGGSGDEGYGYYAVINGITKTGEYSIPVNDTPDKYFVGWNTAANGSSTGYSEEPSSVPTRNMILYAQWADPVDVNFDANGGKFSNDTTTKTMKYVQQPVTKYSYTKNILEDGTQNGGYESYWSNNSIRGSGRTTANDEAHVITIPGASSLNVTITYATCKSDDYACVWQGSHPDYNAENNYESSVSGRLYGDRNTETYTIPGDTVTLSFYAGDVEDATYYGYYAVVTGLCLTYASGDYEEPEHEDEDKQFVGWNTAADGSGIQYNGRPSILPSDSTLYAQWREMLVVAYDANGGKFSNNKTRHTMRYESLSEFKYSYTENIAEDGTQNDYYGDYYGRAWSNKNIRGSGRESGSTDAHVVTIPGAASLTVTIDYEGESTSYDWACVWTGSHPDYNAEDNYESSVSGKLGGSRDQQTFEIEGDSVTFSFRSDGGGSGDEGYGYYAVIQGKSVAYGRYKEPEHEDDHKVFTGWNTAADGSGDQYYGAPTNVEENMTLYAQWGTMIAVVYNANGGKFSNDETRNVVKFQPSANTDVVRKYSYTENLNEDRSQNYSYGDDWSECNIRGSGRESGNTDAHVVTIPGASSLTVTIDYEGESTSYDWACVWAGSHPDYKAEDNYQSSVSGKLGGSRAQQTYEIEGDSVTFGFRSDGGGSGNEGYGYYAVIEGVPGGGTIGEYKEPTHENNLQLFDGWNTEADGSGTKYTGEIRNATEDMTLYAQWQRMTVVTYDANGSKFDDDSTRNVLTYKRGQTYKYSYTENLNEDGSQKYSYSDDWSEYNIRGSGRTTASDEAHVVTIPGATSLTVTIDYEGESDEYDWACVWEGSHPEYSAYNDYDYSISGKLGGSRSSSTYEIQGDSVTFGFRSDGSGNGDEGYGYYAVIAGNSPNSKVLHSGEYKEPVSDDELGFFAGWNTEADGSGDTYRSETQFSEDTTLYAQWDAPVVVTYDANGIGNFGSSDATTNVVYYSNQSAVSGTYQNPQPNDSAYAALSWNTAPDGSGTSYQMLEIRTLTESTTVYAQWSNEKHSGTCGGVSWRIDYGGCLTLYPTNGVSGTLMSNSEDDSDFWPWVEYEDSDDLIQNDILSVKVEDGVIGNDSCSWLLAGLVNATSIDVSGLDLANTENWDYMFYSDSALEEVIGLNDLDTSSLESMEQIFGYCSKIDNMDMSNWDTSRITDMSQLFRGCFALKNLNIKDWDVSNVTTMNSMFSECSSMRTMDLSGWNTSNVTNLAGMFYSCRNLTSLNTDGWDTGNVIATNQMFYGCSSLTNPDVDDWDTSNLKNVSQMFYNCSSLTTLDLSGWNTSNVTNLANMFYYCSKLVSVDTTGWDTSHVTSMYYTFYNCSSLTALDLSGWDTSSVTSMGYMFYNASNLKSLDLSNFNTDKVTNMQYMFGYCSNLLKLDVSGFDTTKANTNSMFYNTSNLNEVTLGPKFYATTNNLTLPSPNSSSTTGQWVKADNKSLAYTPSDMRTNWNETTMPGTWVWQMKSTYGIVQFEPNGGKFISSDASVTTTNVNETITMPTVEKSGYTLTEWNLDKNGKGRSFQPGDRVNDIVKLGEISTVYAIWRTNSSVQITVKHMQQNPNDLDEYELVETETFWCEPDKSFTPAVKRYQGKISPAVQTIVPAEDGTEVEYRYDCARYTVRFDGNDANDGTVEDISAVIGGTLEMPENSYKKRNVIFSGWNTNADGTGTAYQPGDEVSSLSNVDGAVVTFYAQWVDAGTEATVENGAAVVEMHGGETAVIPNLPHGTSYEVEEIEIPDGWTQDSISNESGTLAPGDVTSVQVTNSYSASGSVSITAHKKLNGDNIAEGQFRFELMKRVGGTDEEPEYEVIETVSNGPVDTTEFDENEQANKWYGTAPIMFTPVNVTQAGEYTFYVREVRGSNDTVNYDNHIETVTATAVDNGHGVLNTETTYSESGCLFINSMQACNLNFNVKTGNTTTAANENELTFLIRLKDRDGYDLPLNTGRIVRADGSETELDENGSFTTAPTESVAINGLPYGCTYKITMKDEPGFEVTDSENNEGTITAANSSAGIELAYSSVGEFHLTGTKHFVDQSDANLVQDIVAGEFVFELTDDLGTVLQTATAQSDGSITFAPIAINEQDDGKVAAYWVREQKGERNQINWDDHSEEVYVTMSDDGHGNMNAEISLDDDGIDFTNSVKSTVLNLNGVVKMDGEPAAAGMFEFELLRDGEVVDTVANGENGSIHFTKRFIDSDEFNYVVRQKATNSAGNIVQDMHDEVVAVSVLVDDETGDVSVISNPDDTGVLFENKTIKLVFNVTSENVTDIASARTFTFQINLEDSEGHTLSPTSLTLTKPESQSNQLSSDGKFTMSPNDQVVLTGLPLGSSYAINMVRDVNGFASANGNNSVTGTIAEADNEATYAMVYASSGSFQLEGRKYFVDTGDSNIGLDVPANTFQFDLLDESGTVIQTVYAQTDGTFEFEPVAVSESDDGAAKTYQIREREGNSKQTVWDDHTEEIQINASDNGYGNMNVQVVLDNDGIVFTNSKKSATLQIPGKVLLDGVPAESGLFEFELVKDDEVIGTVWNDDDGAIQFENRFYDAGTFDVIIRQKMSYNMYVIQDMHDEAVSVQVTVDEDGNVSAVGTPDETGVLFKNKTVPGALEVKKQTKGSSAANKDDEFKIKINFFDRNGDPVDASGNGYEWYIVDRYGNDK